MPSLIHRKHRWHRSTAQDRRRNRQVRAVTDDGYMAALERPTDRATLQMHQTMATVGRELRVARIQAGLSQRTVARGAGMSQAQVSRLERGAGVWQNMIRIARACAVVGLDLSVRTFPAGTPLRDAGHIALLSRLRQETSAEFRWATEVPLPIPGDRRAWDSVGRSKRSDFEIFVEAETRLRDIQALTRRVMLKKRDSGGPRVVLLVRDSRFNRSQIAATGDILREVFPVASRVALAALRAGRDPGGDSMVIL